MVEYVEVNESDLQECSKLFVNTFNAPPWNDKWSYETAYNRLKDIMNTPGFWGLLGKENGEVKVVALGCLQHWYDGEVYEIKELYTHKELRGKGLGTQIMSRLTHRLEEKGVKSVWLITAEGDKTEKFYFNNGYKKIEKMIMMNKHI